MKKSEAVLELILLAANLTNDAWLSDELLLLWEKEMEKKKGPYID